MTRRSSIVVNRTLYQLGVITLVTAILWVGVEVYGTTNKVVVADVDKSILEPINPTLDQEAMELLSGRLKVEVDLTIPLESSASVSINMVDEAVITEASGSATIEGEAI